MMQPPSPFAGIHKVFFVLIIIGAFAVLGLINSDIVNPITSLAEADRYMQETDQIKKDQALNDKLQEQQTALDLEKSRQQAALELQKSRQQTALELQKSRQQAAFELQKSRQQIALETEKSRQQAVLELEMSRLSGYGKIAAGMIAAICISAILLIFTVQLTRKRLVLAPAQVQVKRIDAWHDPTLRKQEIESARRRERVTRELKLRQAQTAIVPAFYPEDVPISWEDIRQQFAEARKTRKAN